MRSRNRRWVFHWIFIWAHLHLISSADIPPNSTQPHNENSKDFRSIFSPRMDYEQWKPLGRGDPLKNDPTYDYVPPALDKVQFWIDPALRTPDLPPESQKTEILLLGVSSKKPSTGTSPSADSRKDTYDSFLKFVDGPKFNSHQRVSRPNFASSYFPSLPFYNKAKPYSKHGPEQQRVPYTMLMPPPIVTKDPNIPPMKPLPMTPAQTTTNPTTVKATPSSTTSTTHASSAPGTTPQVTVETSKLVYQSSSLGGLTETSTSYSSYPTSYSSYPSSTNAKPFNEDVIFQKHLKPPESYIQIQFAPSRHSQFNTSTPLLLASSDHSINYVTPPPVLDEVMHKGQVSDGKLDISNTYVKIGKTEAKINRTMDDAPEILIREPPTMMLFSHVKHPVPEKMQTQIPVTMQTIQSMQTMQPPPMFTSPVYKKATNPIVNALEIEKVSETTTAAAVTSTSMITSTTPAYTTRIPSTTRITTTSTTTTTPTTPTTTTTSLTTDPLFKHYKQPTEPLRGPLYLIIQGHSKVKTYGPSKQVHGIRVQETNEISDDRDEYRVKHLHDYMRSRNVHDHNGEIDAGLRQGRSGDLQTLKHVIQTGFGAIDFGNIKRSDVKETELKVGYQVGESATSEKYHKGIVEEARRLKMHNL